MQVALEALRDKCRYFKTKKLAIPLIGCGLDKLEWSKVSEMIQNTFKDEDVEILVCRQ